MSDIVAYADTVTLEKATWDTPFGMYALFALNQPLIAKEVANPFKKFTKRRSGRTGTRFGAVFTCADGSIQYQDEVMLKGWADGTSGWKLTLYLNPDDDGFHPFMHQDKGMEFALAMVELDDDNTVIDQVKRDKVEKGPRKQTLSNVAAMFCRTPEFWVYIESATDVKLVHEDWGPEVAKAWMCQHLGIKSRSEIDHDLGLAERFHHEIRKPYAAWRANQ